MLAVTWANLGYAGAFIFGLLVGTIATIRLAKVIAEFFAGLRRHHDEGR